MSASASVLSDHSKLSLFDRWYFRLESVLNFLSGVAIFALVLLATINVLGRWLFSLPVDGYIDWVEQAMAFIAFLGIAYAMRQGAHIRMDIVIGRLRGRLLWASELISSLLMLAVTLVLIYGSYLHFLRAYQIGDSSLDINLPTWPAKLVVPVALSILALRLLMHVLVYSKALFLGEARPVAVPLVESPADIAAKEAVSVMQCEQKS